MYLLCLLFEDWLLEYAYIHICIGKSISLIETILMLWVKYQWSTLETTEDISRLENTWDMQTVV